MVPPRVSRPIGAPAKISRHCCRMDSPSLGVTKLLQILRLSGRYRMIGYRSKSVRISMMGGLDMAVFETLTPAEQARQLANPEGTVGLAVADWLYENNKQGLGYPFNRTGRFVSKGDSTKVAPSWADVRVVSAAWEEQPLGSGS